MIPVPSQYSALPWDVTPILAPKPPEGLTGSPSGVLLATGIALVPALIIGGMIGANAAGYTDKQREWGLYGAAIAGGVAALALAINALRR